MSGTRYIIRNTQTGRYAETRPYDGSVDWWAAVPRHATRYSTSEVEDALKELFPNGVDGDAFILIDADRSFEDLWNSPQHTGAQL